jgi:hypothetical protein
MPTAIDLPDRLLTGTQPHPAGSTPQIHPA